MHREKLIEVALPLDALRITLAFAEIRGDKIRNICGE